MIITDNQHNHLEIESSPDSDGEVCVEVTGAGNEMARVWIDQTAAKRIIKHLRSIDWEDV